MSVLHGNIGELTHQRTIDRTSSLKVVTVMDPSYLNGQ